MELLQQPPRALRIDRNNLFEPSNRARDLALALFSDGHCQVEHRAGLEKVESERFRDLFGVDAVEKVLHKFHVLLAEQILEAVVLFVFLLQGL